MAAMTGNAIREALEPFAKVAEHDIGADESDTDFFQPMVRYNSAPRLTVGDLRRARTAYDAIGSGVKALIERARIATNNAVFSDEDPQAVLDWAEEAALLLGDFMAALSTHTAAGAGPVGEVVAASIAAMVDEWYRHPAVPNIPAIPADMIQRRLARFEARPVEDPGEVEALALGRAFDEGYRHGERSAEAALAESEQIAQGLASDLAGTQEELAETRERLDNLKTAAGKARTALAGFTSVNDAAYALDVALAAASSEVVR